MNTFIINLKKSVERKEYMQKLLADYPFLNINFIEAVDGRVLSDEEKDKLFDMPNSILRYGRRINDGEIGCILSHRKCYEELIASNNDYALILEDDISIVNDLNVINKDQVHKFLDNSNPKVLLLSGDYWYWNDKPITKVFDAVGGYSYIINTKAAKIILNSTNRPSNVADDWAYYKTLGIKLYALHPYVIDANIFGFQSDIQQEHWGNIKSDMSFKYIIQSYYNGLIKKLLVYAGHFQSKIRQ